MPKNVGSRRKTCSLLREFLRAGQGVKIFLNSGYFLHPNKKEFLLHIKKICNVAALHKHYPTLRRKRVLDSIPNIMINRNVIFTYYTPYATLATLQRFWLVSLAESEKSAIFASGF